MSKSLHGTRRFTAEDLAAIAAATGVSVDWILTGSTAAPPPPLGMLEVYIDLRADLARAGHPQVVDMPVVFGDFPGADPGGVLAQAAVLHARRKALDPVFDDLPEVIELGFGIDVAVLAAPAPVHVDTATITLLVVPPGPPEVQRPQLAAELGWVLAARMGLQGQELLEEAGRRFAAAFLLPDDVVTPLRAGGGQDLVQHAARHNVSPAFLQARLVEFSDAAPAAAGAGAGVRIPVPARAGYDGVRALRRAMQPRGPGLIARDACRAHAHAAWPPERLAEALGLPTDAVTGDPAIPA